jgi:hypothetical protein
VGCRAALLLTVDIHDQVARAISRRTGGTDRGAGAMRVESCLGGAAPSGSSSSSCLSSPTAPPGGSSHSPRRPPPAPHPLPRILVLAPNFFIHSFSSPPTTRLSSLGLLSCVCQPRRPACLTLAIKTAYALPPPSSSRLDSTLRIFSWSVAASDNHYLSRACSETNLASLPLPVSLP